VPLTLLVSAILMTSQSAVASALTPSSTGAPGYRPPTSSVVSAVNAWALGPLTGTQLDQQFAGMAGAGVKLVRLDASWLTIEPKAPVYGVHAYNFSYFDYRVWLMAQHHLTWLPILDYSAPWAASVSGDWRSPPANDLMFAAYAQAVAARYGPGGSFWEQYPSVPYEPVRMYEVWNEENGGYFWDTGSDPGGYAALYLATRAAIRTVVPSAQVIVGGLVDPVSRATSFIAGMFAAQPGLRGHVDGIALHPYASNDVDVALTVRAVRLALNALGEGAVPLELTEFGWTTDGSTTGESARAKMYASLGQVLANSDCGIGVVAPYDWMNPGATASNDWGLSGASGLRAGGLAWFAGLRAGASRPQNFLCYTAPSSGAHTSSARSSAGRSAVARPTARRTVAKRVASRRARARRRSHRRAA
jgi:hypothetical protein